MSLDIFLMDTNPHIQKTLHYFLYHYAPTIHNIDSKEPLTEEMENLSPDVIFLDSDQIDQFQNLEKFQNKENPPPVVLLSRDEAILKKYVNDQKYQAQLKKPIDPDQLRQLISHLVPRVKNLKITPYLNFYYDNEMNSSSEEIPPVPDLMSNIPETKSSFQSSPPQNQNTPISIPDDLSFTDEKTFSSIHEKTNSFKKISDPILKSQNESMNTTIQDKEISSPTSSSPISFISEENKFEKTSTDSTFSIQSQVNKMEHKPASKIKQNFIQTDKGVPVSQKIIYTESAPKQALQEDIVEVNFSDFQSSMPHTNSLSQKTHLLGHSISKLIDQKFKANWQTYSNDSLKQEVHTLISEHINNVFDSQVKKFIEKEIAESLHKIIKDICLKLIPEISKQIIKEELKKIKIKED